MQPAELILVLANAVAGREAEFSSWYTDEHLPEVVRLAGVASAQRYEVPEALAAQLPYRYATVYAIDGSAAAAMQRIISAEYSSQSDALDVHGMVMSPFVPLGAPITPA